MEAVIQILEAKDLMPIMYIPLEMQHSRIEVTLRPIEKTSEEEETKNMQNIHHI
jgi:hypothetical protein